MYRIFAFVNNVDSDQLAHPCHPIWIYTDPILVRNNLMNLSANCVQMCWLNWEGDVDLFAPYNLYTFIAWANSVDPDPCLLIRIFTVRYLTYYCPDSKQYRSRSDGRDVLADLDLHWLHMHKNVYISRKGLLHTCIFFFQRYHYVVISLWFIYAHLP
jgi:hypothetical protein